MLYNQIENFIISTESGTRIVGIDVGTKTIGIAISDKDRNLSTPKTTIRRKGNKKDIPLLLKFLEENKIGGIIVGLPLTEDDQETGCSLFIRRFTDNLSKSTELPILFFDERLSSFMAEDFMITTMGVKFRKTKEIVDQTAASFILQNFLDRTKQLLSK